jgi:ppGpp synthetase/RelA/SpoT-type nucleotidyltranferase
MGFSPVPQESKGQIDKAGQILANSKAHFENASSTDFPIMLDEYEWAWVLAARWRACHAYPINTFQATLRNKVRRLPDNIVAQRLKRMPTIIDKLARYPTMALSRMQDIGGVRAILPTVLQAEKLAQDYLNNASFQHELINKKNYIDGPRDEDGYRSIHLIYRYKNKVNPNYDGLRVELQIRSRLQHTWATAVETMGTFLGQALKSRQGDKEWLDFFTLTSCAFAHLESRPAVPRYVNLTRQQIFALVAEMENEISALEKMKGFSAAVSEITKTRGEFYHLIILDSLHKTVQIQPYDRENAKKALEDYTKYEERAAKGEKIEPVLVSAGPLDQIKRAYPNFFLDIGQFVKEVNRIVRN